MQVGSEEDQHMEAREQVREQATQIASQGVPGSGAARNGAKWEIEARVATAASEEASQPQKAGRAVT